MREAALIKRDDISLLLDLFKIALYKELPENFTGITVGPYGLRSRLPKAHAEVILEDVDYFFLSRFD